MFLLSNINLTERYVDKMSDQKYYVALKCDLSHRMSREVDHIGYFFHGTDKKVKSSTFTKSELSKIMDGALYHVSDDKCDYCRYSSDTCGDEHCEEWINPLIELVPVEDDE